MSKGQRIDLIKIIVAGCIFGVLMVLEHMHILDAHMGGHGGYNLLELFLFLIPYAIVGYDVVIEALINIKNGKFFNENLLMFVATVGAFVVGECAEGVAVLLFYKVGELFEDYAVNRSRKSIKELMDIMPEFANVEKDGQIIQVDPYEVEIGETILIKPGEKIPLDGIIIKGETMVDTSSLTGESLPRMARVGDEVISGCVNQNSLIYVKTTKDYDNSTVAKILELVENASSKKAKAEKFITKFAKYYTPIVVFAALAIFLIPSFITGEWFLWLTRACNFLVVSCPCALVISVPLGFFGGIGSASRAGILIKGGNYLEAAANISTVVFDKTGTLTKGVFLITDIKAEEGISKEEILRIAAHIEQSSNHPIALSIKNEFVNNAGTLDATLISNVEEIGGHGIVATFNGEEVYAGNSKLMNKYGISFKENTAAGTVVYVAKKERYLGSIVISDVIKEEAIESINLLKKAGIKECVMLTGDRKEAGEYVASQIGIDNVYTDLLPQNKVEIVEDLLSKKESRKNLAFVGDGINDTPVLARSDIGFAMGGIGSDAAIEAADIVIMDDDIRKISKTIEISKFALRIIKQNISFALITKIGIIILSALGLVNMWIAVFGDVGVAMICILNAMRSLSKGKKKEDK